MRRLCFAIFRNFFRFAVETVAEFVDFTCGADVLTGKAFSRLENNIVKDIYRLNKTELRASWDLVAVLYAVEAKKEFFGVSEYGKVEVTDTGKTLFTVGGGRHRYVSLKADEAEIADCLEKILQLNHLLIMSTKFRNKPQHHGNNQSRFR